jgi:anti-sigma factor RsiW
MSDHDMITPDTELGRYATYYRAPLALQSRIRSSLHAAHRPERHATWTRGFALAATIAAVSVVSWNGALLTAGPSENEMVAQEVATAHIRSLLGDGHLNDVVSTDQHTVKPWFSGKLDFAPPVQDYASAGLRLTGGRLDYLEGRQVAALTYAHERHVVNLFIWPAQSGQDAPPMAVSRQGYSMRHWMKGGMNYWAVSDIDPQQLASLTDLLRKSP